MFEIVRTTIAAGAPHPLLGGQEGGVIDRVLRARRSDTTYIVTGAKPGLRADPPPAGLIAACDVDGRPGLELSR